MGLICIALGGFVLESSGQSEYFVAGHVLISLAAICLALFTTAFIIISQLTRGVNTFYNTLFPIIGYAGSIITMIWGWALLAGNDVMADEFVAGHVIFGGVDTNELSSRTMEARKVPGLYFIGEVMDVTGWLGGYNFQWAWSSAWACAQDLIAAKSS